MAIRSLQGKRVLITGAASGIGRATALQAAREGAELVLTDINAERLQEAEREVHDSGGRVLVAAALDVADHAAVADFAREVHAGHASMDVVMNIAGISTWGSVETLEHRHWRRTVDIDLMGPIHVIESFLPEMIRAGRGGHLVNVSSAAGLLGLPWHGPYSAAKFGLRGVSEVLRFDLRRHHIGVTLVCPGAVRTPLVGTVDIVGIDREHPIFRKLTKRFEARAVAPEKAAAKIIGGMKRGRYLVFTSPDVWAGYALQRFFPPGYVLIMQLANNQFQRLAARARA